MCVCVCVCVRACVCVGVWVCMVVCVCSMHAESPDPSIPLGAISTVNGSARVSLDAIGDSASTTVRHS